MLGAWSTGHTQRLPVAAVRPVEFAGAVGAFLDANVRVLSVAVALTFDTPNGYLNVLADSD